MGADGFERVIKGEDPGVRLSPDFPLEDKDATKRIHTLSLRLGLPAPVPGQPLPFVLVAILERLADDIDALRTNALHTSQHNHGRYS